jgi:hypothetical protein
MKLDASTPQARLEGAVRTGLLHVVGLTFVTVVRLSSLDARDSGPDAILEG